MTYWIKTRENGKTVREYYIGHTLVTYDEWTTAQLKETLSESTFKKSKYKITIKVKTLMEEWKQLNKGDNDGKTNT